MISLFYIKELSDTHVTLLHLLKRKWCCDITCTIQCSDSSFRSKVIVTQSADMFETVMINFTVVSFFCGKLPTWYDKAPSREPQNI